MNDTRKFSQAEKERRDRQRAMSIAEFCGRYGPGRTTAYQEIKLGRLRAHKCGKRTIITADDAEDWLRRLPVMPSDRAEEARAQHGTLNQ
jgi:hypothetical protein